MPFKLIDRQPTWQEYLKELSSETARKFSSAYSMKQIPEAGQWQSICACCGSYGVLPDGTSSYKGETLERMSGLRTPELGWEGIWFGLGQDAQTLMGHGKLESTEEIPVETLEIETDGVKFSFAWKDV